MCAASNYYVLQCCHCHCHASYIYHNHHLPHLPSVIAMLPPVSCIPHPYTWSTLCSLAIMRASMAQMLIAKNHNIPWTGKGSPFSNTSTNGGTEHSINCWTHCILLLLQVGSLLQVAILVINLQQFCCFWVYFCTIVVTIGLQLLIDVTVHRVMPGDLQGGD